MRKRFELQLSIGQTPIEERPPKIKYEGCSFGHYFYAI